MRTSFLIGAEDSSPTPPPGAITGTADPVPWPPLWLLLGRLSLQRPLDGCGAQAYVTENGAPQDPATRRPVPPQSTETVPTRAACSLRATERAVSRGMSRGFCTGRPRRPMWTVTRGSDQALLLPG